jgi:hypothetical protein
LISAWLEGESVYQIAAIDLKGHVRHPLIVPEGFTPQDVAPGGAWLATSDDTPTASWAAPRRWRRTGSVLARYFGLAGDLPRRPHPRLE